MSKITEFLTKLAKPAKEGGICAIKKSVEKLREKIKFVENNKFEDEPLWINHLEEHLLGISLSAPKVFSYDTSAMTHECKDFLFGKVSEAMTFAVDIMDVKVYKTKTGKSQGLERADLMVTDGTGKLKVKVWSSEYVPNASILVFGNSIILTGKPGYGYYSDFVVATSIKQAK